MNKNPSLPLVILAALTLLLCSTTGSAQSAVEMETARVSDDIGPDGLKLRGDGSIDDSQPGGGDSENDHRIVLEDTDVRTRTADGTRTRDRRKVTINAETGERRERTRSRVKLADGSEVETRTEIRTDADGNVLRERTRTREKSANGGDRSGHGHGGSDRADRADRAERPERADRAERPERAERAER